MQWPGKIRKTEHAFFAICLVAIGCSVVPWGGDDYDRQLSIAQYEARYSTFGDPWVGHRVEELIQDRGPPDSVLEAKPRKSSFEHGVHVLSYIYYNDTTAAQTCIDVFVVVEDSGTIIKYYCR